MSTATPAAADILIIEDDDDMARILEHRLGRAGFATQRVRDGKQGLARLETLPLPRLVTLDVMMPYMSGFDVLREIRARPALQALPVLMLTSMAREEDVVRGIGGGATEYLTKPFKPGELVARVRRLLDEKAGGS